MEKHVSSIGKTDLIGLSSSSLSSQLKREDKASGSMSVDPSQYSMESLISTMKQMMKQETMMMHMLQKRKNRPKEYPKPSYDQQRRYNNNQEDRRNFNIDT